MKFTLQRCYSVVDETDIDVLRQCELFLIISRFHNITYYYYYAVCF